MYQVTSLLDQDMSRARYFLDNHIRALEACAPLCLITYPGKSGMLLRAATTYRSMQGILTNHKEHAKMSKNSLSKKFREQASL